MTELDSTAASAEVVRIAQQAKEISQKRNGKQADTLFYKVVLGGNIKVTSQVVNYMEQNSMDETLNWLLKRNPFDDTKHSEAKSSRRLFLIRLATFLILSVISTLLTPIFYVVHILTNAFFNQKRKRIADDIRLPLAFAAFSQDAELLQYFHSLGVNVENIDEQGNNVLHYIADLSSVAADNACRIFSSIVNFIDDSDTVQNLLIKNRNSSGHTAMEYAVKFGSPVLQLQILNQPNLLQHTAFAVGKQEVRFDDDTECKEHPASLPDASTRLEYVDVTMYEAGSLADQSTLLNLLSDRSVDMMSREELKIFNPANFFGTWINLKVRQLLPGVALMHIIDFIVTILLLHVIYISNSGKSGDSFNKWQDQLQWDGAMEEIRSFAEDGFGTVLTRDAHKRALDEIQREAKKTILPILYDLDNPAKKTLLFNTTVENFTNVSEYYNGSEVNWNPTVRVVDTPIWIMDAFYNSAKEHIEFRDKLALIHVALNYINVAQDLAKQFKKYYYEKKDHNKLMDSDGIKSLCGQVYQEFMKRLGIPRELYDYCWLNEALCINAGYFNMSDIIVTKDHNDVVKAVKYIGGTCTYKTLINLASKKNECRSYETSTLIKTVFPDSEKFRDTDMMLRLIHIASCLYITLDIIERCVFMYTCVCKQSSMLQMFVTALSHKLPGSYVRKQINLSTYLAIVGTYFFVHLHFTGDIEIMPMFHSWDLYKLVTVLCSIFRFLLHIHSLRLLPGIGHFVITTIMMGTNLVHFSTIFGIVLFIFSVLFHILIDDQDCPIEKAAGFETILDSMFSTFKLTFGHGDFHPFYYTTPVKLTYTLYVIIVGLLLMNLIIAIMTTTATEIMADPWRGALWKVEWLDEATSAEYTFSILGLPFRKFTNLNLSLLSRVGYVVKKVNDKRSKVYVEVFHCLETE